MSERPRLSAAGYQDLVVWQRAMDLIDQIYSCTRDWPGSEMYGLSSQIRRAAVSIAANIAEGNGRNGRHEYVHHLGITRGSLHEVETMVLIAQRQKYLDEGDKDSIIACIGEVGRMLSGLIKSLSPT